MSPQDNFNFLNAYLRRVSPIIRQYNGFIDKYIGDAVMALFPEKTEQALQAAIDMRQEILRYNEKRVKQGYEPIDIGTSIHTGSLMLGTIGEQERMESTVISDDVNLAFRLEGLTKLYGAPIVISQETLFGLDQPTQYQFRFLDRVLVKGKKEAVSVFEIFDGDPPEIVDLKLETRTDFEKGLLYYHSQEFVKAQEHFGQVLKCNPDDKAAQLYMKRATYFQQYGVPLNWEGVEALAD
jgi:two-component system sensor histidine kinase ChiS